MSHNPVRAANFRKTGRKPIVRDPHAGIKHSEIMRRQGFGTTLPTQRAATPTGFTSEVFEGDGFTVRQDLLAAGNSSGVGVAAEHDRVFHVLRGVLYIVLESDNGAQEFVQVQEGGNFVAKAGTRHGYATSGTAEVSLLIIEDAGFAEGWQVLSAPVQATHQHPLEAAHAPQPQPYVIGSGQQQPAPSSRRRDQSKAKNQAAMQAHSKRRRQPKKVSSMGQGQAMPQQAGGQTVTGATRIGHNSPTNANSSNVDGVNPKPTMGL